MWNGFLYYGLSGTSLFKTAEDNYQHEQSGLYKWADIPHGQESRQMDLICIEN